MTSDTTIPRPDWDRPGAQLAKLARPFPSSVIDQTPDKAKADYVEHAVVNQWLLGIVGPFDYELAHVWRGPVLERTKRNDRSGFFEGKSEVLLADAIVGATYRLTATVDGRRVRVEQTGDVKDATNWPHDGARLQTAESDALKRCAMRLGLGLHLWADVYVLAERLNRVPLADGPVTREMAEQAAQAIIDQPAEAAPGPVREGPGPARTTEPEDAKEVRPAKRRRTGTPAGASEAKKQGTPQAPASDEVTTAVAETAPDMPALCALLDIPRNRAWLRLRRAKDDGTLPATFPDLPDVKAVDNLDGEAFELARAFLLDTFASTAEAAHA
jgi:hypothetical protein